jgi:hypothetical protein
MVAVSNRRRRSPSMVAKMMLSCNMMSMALAFSNNPSQQHRPFGVASRRIAPLVQPSCPTPYNNNNNKNTALSMGKVKFEKIADDDDQVIAFMDSAALAKGIDCYVDSYATVDGVEYTIGNPCDYAVALCYFAEDDQLVPIELDDPLMEDIFPIAEGIIEDEFGEELVLLRTPQTLTLVGELEEDEEEDESIDDVDDFVDGVDESEEEVEILVSFEENGQEFHLVRLLDPVLLVGKIGNENTRILLTPEESDIVMPQLESVFMSYQDDEDA